jgi:hypothetical protein
MLLYASKQLLPGFKDLLIWWLHSEMKVRLDEECREIEGSKLLTCIQQHALSHGYAITTISSNPHRNITLGCDRGGIYIISKPFPIETKGTADSLRASFPAFCPIWSINSINSG